jgi:hypothetical protein
MKKKPEASKGTTIQHCNFIGVQWDKPALETVQTVAQALLNLTALFRSTGLEVPMIEIRGDEAKINGKP